MSLTNKPASHAGFTRHRHRASTASLISTAASVVAPPPNITKDTGLSSRPHAHLRPAISICWGYTGRYHGRSNRPASASQPAFSVTSASHTDNAVAAVIIQVRTVTGGSILHDGYVLRRVQAETRTVSVRGLSSFGGDDRRFPPSSPKKPTEEELEEQGERNNDEADAKSTVSPWGGKRGGRDFVSELQLPPDYESRFLSWKEKEQEKLMKRFRKEFEEQEAKALKELAKRLEKEREEQGEKEEKEKKERREKEKEIERERRHEENKRDRIVEVKDGGSGKPETKSIPQPIPLLHPFSKFPQHQKEEHSQAAYREQRAQPKAAPEISLPGGAHAEAVTLTAEEVGSEVTSLPLENPSVVTLTPSTTPTGVSPLQEGGLRVSQAQEGPKPPAPQQKAQIPEVPIASQVAEVVDMLETPVAPAESMENVAAVESIPATVSETSSSADVEIANISEAEIKEDISIPANDNVDAASVEAEETSLEPVEAEAEALEAVEEEPRSLKEATSEEDVSLIEEAVGQPVEPIAEPEIAAHTLPIVSASSIPTPAVPEVDASAPALLPTADSAAVVENAPEPSPPATLDFSPIILAELSQMQKSLADVTGVVNKLDSTMDYELNSVLIQLRLWRREVEKLALKSGAAQPSLFLEDVQEIAEKPQVAPQSPVEYKILTISPDPPHHLLTTDLTVASGNAPVGTPGKSIQEFLPSLKSPYLFLQHVPTLTSEGWELVSGAEEMLVFRRKATQAASPAVEAPPQQESLAELLAEAEVSDFQPQPVVEEPTTVFEASSSGYNIRGIGGILKPQKPLRPYYNTEHLQFQGHGLGGIAGDGVSFSHGVNPVDMTPREATSVNEETDEKLVDEERERLLEWESKRTDAINSMQAALSETPRTVEAPTPSPAPISEETFEEKIKLNEAVEAQAATIKPEDTEAAPSSTEPEIAPGEEAGKKKKGSRTGRFFKRLGWLIVWGGAGLLVVKEVGYWSAQAAAKKKLEDATASGVVSAAPPATSGSVDRFGVEPPPYFSREGGAVRPGSRYSWSDREKRAEGGERFVGRNWGEGPSPSR
ncbi:hypothetical protein DFH27DRAFT_303181 [Peziza echinospora]|nr:hypothetical protein DFH27DRAFT_303181 [Peziza echinospora]